MPETQELFCKYGFIHYEDNSELHITKYIPSLKIQGISNIHEIDVLSRIRHTNIIHSSNVISSENGVFLVFPLFERTLMDLVLDPVTTTDIKIPIVYKIASAIHFLHQQNITNFNLSANTILLNGLEPHLSDFSKCTLGTKDITQVSRSTTLDPNVSCPHWVTKDVSTKGTRSMGVKNYYHDVWNFGISCLFIFSGQIPPENINKEWLSDIKFYEYFLSHISYKNLIIDLISAMLNPQPEKRPSAEEILLHPLFKNINKISQYASGDNKLLSKYIIESGSERQENLIIPDYSNCSISDDHRDVIKLLYHWCKTIYPKTPASLFFFSVDILNRTAPFYKDKTATERMTIAASCLLISLKLHNIDFNIEEYNRKIRELVPDMKVDMILKHEIIVIGLLNGVINHSKYYNCCINTDQLKTCFYNVLFSKDTTLYYKTDEDKLMQTLKEQFPNPDDKNIIIDDL